VGPGAFFLLLECRVQAAKYNFVEGYVRQVVSEGALRNELILSSPSFVDSIPSIRMAPAIDRRMSLNNRTPKVIRNLHSHPPPTGTCCGLPVILS